MSSRRLEFSRNAQTDIDDILQFTLEHWGLEQAETYGRKIAHVCEQIAHFPEIGVRRSERAIEFRLLPVEQHLVIYGVTPDVIQILRIVHRSADWTLTD